MEREGSVKRGAGTSVSYDSSFFDTPRYGDRGNEKTWTSPRLIAFQNRIRSFFNSLTLEIFDDSNGKWYRRSDRQAIWLLDVSYRHTLERETSVFALHPRYPFKICTGFAACSGSFTRSESRSIYSPLAWAARRSLSCCWPVVNSTQLTLTLNLAPVLCLCSDIPRNSQAIAQGIAPRVCPASGVPSIVWDFPAKR